MYILIEYSDNYSKTSGILWLFYRDVLAVDGNGAIVDFNVGTSNATKMPAVVAHHIQQIPEGWSFPGEIGWPRLCNETYKESKTDQCETTIQP